MSTITRVFERTFILMAFSCLLTACSSAGGPLGDVMAGSPEEANKAVAKSYIEATGIAGQSAMLGSAHADNYLQIRQEFENLYDNAMGDAQISAAMQDMTAAFPDRTSTVTRLLGEGDMVAATYRIKGTHSANFFGIPATGKAIEIDGAAVFKLADGKIQESFMMADEAGLMRQLGAKLPAREDGQIVISPKRGKIYTYDEKLAEHIANPKDTAEFMQSRLLLAYKSLPENRPADYKFEGRPYTKYLRSGIVNIVERGAELGVKGGHRESISGRRDMVSAVISDGEYSMMLFRLTAQNTGPLYGIPPSGNPMDDWELGFARFEGDQWVDGWWFKDELGFLLAIGNEEAQNFLVGD